MPRFCQVGRGHRTFSGVWRTAVCNQIAALEILVHPFKADATVATMADEMPMSIPPIHKVVEPVPSSSRSKTTTTVPRWAIRFLRFFVFFVEPTCGALPERLRAT